MNRKLSERPLTPKQIAYYRKRLEDPERHIAELLEETDHCALSAVLLRSVTKGGYNQSVSEDRRQDAIAIAYENGRGGYLA